MSCEESTYSFLLTPAGTGAIGVVRVMGGNAVDIVSQFFRPVRADGDGWQRPEGINVGQSGVGDTKLFYGHFAVDGEPIDDVLVSRVSWMDEQAVDISAHGGIRVIERILLALERAGAAFCECRGVRPPIWPVRNYIEQEALDALWTARTSRAVRFLAWQRRHLGDHVAAIARRCAGDPVGAGADMQRLVEGWPVARGLVAGVTIALVGPPNSGKSTLFNGLVGRSAAVVSAYEGTTRDWVTASVEFDGVPVTLVDTAGRYEAVDLLEREAIVGGWAAARDADLCLLVLDGSRPWTDRDRRFCQAARRFDRCLVVANKADLPNRWTAADKEMLRNIDGWARPVFASGRTRTGLDHVSAGALRALGFDGWFDLFPCVFTARQATAARDVLLDLPGRPASAAEMMKRQFMGGDTRGSEKCVRSVTDAVVDPNVRAE